MSSSQPTQSSAGKKKISRTLARALKPIFDKSAGNEAATAIIRKPAIYALPDTSTLSLFSELQTRYGVNAPSEQSKTLPPSPPTPHISQLYRLPAFTLSQYSCDQYKYRDITTEPKLYPPKGHSIQTSIIPSRIQNNPHAAEIYPSHQSYPFFPELQTISTQKTRATPIPSIRHSNITDFTIRDSEVPTVRCHVDLPKHEASKPSLRKVGGKSDLRARNSNSQSRSSSGISISDQTRRSSEKSASTHSNASSLSIHALDHFKTFCILDTMLPGNPIALMSSDLGSAEAEQEDDRLFLDIQQGEKDSLDFIADQNDQGEIVHYLVLFGAFLSVGGQDRYILASLINVSHLVDAILEDETPQKDENEDVWLALASETSSLQVSDAPSSSPLSLDDAIQETENIWLDATSHISQTPPSRSRSGASASLSPANAALHAFMEDTESLYKDYFCLARSLVDSSYYEISLVSPSLRESGEDYLQGHLKHTRAETINELAEKLARGRNFAIGVRWGLKGLEKRMYCTPVFGPGLESWVCVLVDGGLRELWDL